MFLTEYEQNNWLADFQFYPESSSYSLVLDSFFNRLFGWNKAFFYTIHGGNYFYPRRLGFIPKRIAMWQLLILLKMWHHLIILLWWCLFIYRSLARRKTSYSMLAVCYFNVYCCYLLGLMIYIIYYAVYLEMWFKFRPGNFTFHRFTLWASSSF